MKPVSCSRALGRPIELGVAIERESVTIDEIARLAAIQEARRGAVRAFGVTIDARAQSHFPLLFGRGVYAVVDEPSRLPALMPTLLRHLAAG
jgi:nitric oxide reductase activation protein